MKRDTVLVIDDDSAMRDSLAEVLSEDFSVLQSSRVKTGRPLIEQGCDAVLLDIRFGGEDDNQEGLDFLEELRVTHPTLPVIMMTGYADLSVALRSLKAGAADFIQKERLDPGHLPSMVARAIQRSRDQRRTEFLERRLEALDSSELVGSSVAIAEIRRTIEVIANDGQVSTLVFGESGTGKELVSRLIHKRGRRAHGPLVIVHVASVGSASIERELFGSSSRATGSGSTMGLVEKADGGVLCLDGIEHLPLPVQGRLLEVLDHGAFKRVGSEVETRVDVQITALAGTDVREAVDIGQFRRDLYFRLKGIEIRMPPLREIRGDIPELSDRCLAEFRKTGRTRIRGFSPEAMECLRSYTFPGNVRELRTIIERAAIMSESHRRRRIEPEDLPIELRSPAGAPVLAAVFWTADKPIRLDRELAWLELLAIDVALERSGGRKQVASGLLGLPYRHVLPRRVARIRRDHPDLISRCPRVDSAFEASGEEGVWE